MRDFIKMISGNYPLLLSRSDHIHFRATKAVYSIIMLSGDVSWIKLARYMLFVVQIHIICIKMSSFGCQELLFQLSQGCIPPGCFRFQISGFDFVLGVTRGISFIFERASFILVF